MQRYIDQLIGDMQEAKNRPRPQKMSLPPELEFVRGAEEYLYGELYEMGNLFGLKKMQFPPVEKLNPEQIKKLVLEFEQLWQAFNFYPDFPDGLPETIKYKILVDYLEHKTTYVTQGNNHFEFCTYDPDSCPFPEEFCTCKDFEIEDDDIDMSNFTSSDKDLPF